MIRSRISFPMVFLAFLFLFQIKCINSLLSSILQIYILASICNYKKYTKMCLFVCMYVYSYPAAVVFEQMRTITYDRSCIVSDSYTYTAFVIYFGNNLVCAIGHKVNRTFIRFDTN